jgi:DNA-binding transcriptional MerR regulator
MKEYYTPNEVASLIGASKQAIRNYTGIYARYLSTEATPERGGVRRFTESDVKLLAFVYTKTSIENLTHEQILERLGQGELEAFEFHIPQKEGKEEQAADLSTALVPLERLQASQALLADAQRREVQVTEEAKQREQTLQTEINRLNQELGRAQGELAVYKRRRPAWWVRLFGGE